MGAKTHLDSIAPTPPFQGEVSDIVHPANPLHKLSEFYESGEVEDDEQNELELMIQLGGMPNNYEDDVAKGLNIAIRINYLQSAVLVN